MKELLDPSAISDLKRIEITTRRVIDSDLLGRYRSAFRGSGLVFSDVREYQPGDDIRHIHWKITARTGKPYVKTFDEDRQLRMMLVVDVSNSTNVGQTKTKHRKELELSALLTLLSLKSQDATGLCLFGETVEEFYPPKQSRSQFQKVVSRLLAPRKLSMKTNIKDALAFLASQLKRPTIIFILSDFLSDPFHDELKLLTYRHDVIGVKFEDVLDTNLPSAGIVEIADAENGQRILVDTGSRRCKEQLKLLELHRTNALRESFRSANADFVTISDHLLEPIIELMRSRTKRY